MDPLASWLETRKDQLIALSVKQLSTQENLRRESEGPVRWFFESLIQAIAQGQTGRLEALLRHWVAMRSIPINGYSVGLLPVLGVFKRAIWQAFQAAPPSEEPLALAARLDAIVSRSAEFLAKVEAAALMDAMSHHLTAQANARSDKLEDLKDSFVSVAAHELKTPLTVIEGYTNMLKLTLPETTHPGEALMIRGLESGVSRLRGLIEDMIDASLIEIDLLSLDFQPVWLRRVLAIAEVEVREALKARKLKLEVQRDTIPGAPTVGDPERLLKAFLKVLFNAIKYTPDGGKITVLGRQLSGFADIVIEDTGIGIAPDNLEIIFEKFAALGDPSRHSSGKVKFKGGGPGLGLMIARGIIEGHGGSIWAESPGQDEERLPGSRFHLMIPLRDVSSGVGMSPSVASAASLLARHVADTAPGTIQPGRNVAQAIERAPVAALTKESESGTDGSAKEALSEAGDHGDQGPKEMSEPTLSRLATGKGAEERGNG
jgi:signal transduction histidine kinase